MEDQIKIQYGFGSKRRHSINNLKAIKNLTFYQTFQSFSKPLRNLLFNNLEFITLFDFHLCALNFTNQKKRERTRNRNITEI